MSRPRAARKPPRGCRIDADFSFRCYSGGLGVIAMKLSLVVGLAWAEVENFYGVGYRGRLAGKIWLATDRLNEETPWEWHLCLPMTLPDHSKGVARSKAEAVQALANSLHTIILRAPAERLERALNFAAATGLDFKAGKEIELSVEEVGTPPRTSVQPAAHGHPETLAATVRAVAQRQAVRPVVSAASPRAPGQVQAEAGKRMPTVKVKMVASAKPPADASRSVAPASRLVRPSSPRVADA